MAGLVYTPTGWVDDDGSDSVGTVFTAARMNNLESGVRQVTDRLNAPGGHMPIESDGGVALDLVQRKAAKDLKQVRALWSGQDLGFETLDDAYTTALERLLTLHFANNGSGGWATIGENVYLGRGPYTGDGGFIKGYIGFGCYWDSAQGIWVNPPFAGNNGWTVLAVDAGGQLYRYTQGGTGQVQRTYTNAAFKQTLAPNVMGYYEGDYQVAGPWYASNAAVPANGGWPFTIPFDAGGNAFAWTFQVSLSGYATAVGVASFTLYLDGAAIKTSPNFYFNQTGVHTTMPTLVLRWNVAAGTHRLQIRQNGVVTSDGNDTASIFITGPVAGGI